MSKRRILLNHTPDHCFCPECGGEGNVEREVLLDVTRADEPQWVNCTIPCDNCDGSGSVDVDPADFCYDHDEYGDWLYHQSKDA
jgi:DnaJ-class molecular chaperone